MDPPTPTSLTNRDFSVWVTSGGGKLPVYALEVNGSKATGYIEARAGQEFQVHVLDNQRQPGHGMSYRLSLDGIK
ncbi:hypothetical protein MNV49_004857 [Pseudohyphozyma bogoriensis]|nr:hypothetical protein MNV49_004857 [Pseudohyphozyma bogoriensis]